MSEMQTMTMTMTCGCGASVTAPHQKEAAFSAFSFEHAACRQARARTCPPVTWQPGPNGDVSLLSVRCPECGAPMEYAGGTSSGTSQWGEWQFWCRAHPGQMTRHLVRWERGS